MKSMPFPTRAREGRAGAGRRASPDGRAGIPLPRGGSEPSRSRAGPGGLGLDRIGARVLLPHQSRDEIAGGHRIGVDDHYGIRRIGLSEEAVDRPAKSVALAKGALIVAFPDLSPAPPATDAVSSAQVGDDDDAQQLGRIVLAEEAANSPRNQRLLIVGRNDHGNPAT